MHKWSNTRERKWFNQRLS